MQNKKYLLLTISVCLLKSSICSPTFLNSAKYLAGGFVTADICQKLSKQGYLGLNWAYNKIDNTMASIPTIGPNYEFSASKWAVNNTVDPIGIKKITIQDLKALCEKITTTVFGDGALPIVDTPAPSQMDKYGHPRMVTKPIQHKHKGHDDGNPGPNNNQHNSNKDIFDTGRLIVLAIGFDKEILNIGNKIAALPEYQNSNIENLGQLTIASTSPEHWMTNLFLFINFATSAVITFLTRNWGTRLANRNFPGRDFQSSIDNKFTMLSTGIAASQIAKNVVVKHLMRLLGYIMGTNSPEIAEVANESYEAAMKFPFFYDYITHIVKLNPDYAIFAVLAGSAGMRKLCYEINSKFIQDDPKNPTPSNEKSQFKSFGKYFVNIFCSEDTLKAEELLASQTGIVTGLNIRLEPGMLASLQGLALIGAGLTLGYNIKLNPENKSFETKTENKLNTEETSELGSQNYVVVIEEKELENFIKEQGLDKEDEETSTKKDL